LVRSTRVIPAWWTPKPKGKKVLEVEILSLVGLVDEHLTGCTLGVDKLGERLLLHGHVAQELGRLDRLLSRVHKDEGLRLAGLVENLFVADLVDGLQPLDCLLLGDTNELLLETNGAVRGVKVEETLLDVDTKEGGDILVVGEGSRETDDTDTVMRLVHLANGTRENRLEHGSTVVVEQVDLVNDDEADEVGVARVGGLAGDDVPLLRGRDNDLGLGDLLLGELRVTSQLGDLDVEGAETLGEGSNLLLQAPSSAKRR
jgi:hypothetical protein